MNPRRLAAFAGFTLLAGVLFISGCHATGQPVATAASETESRPAPQSAVDFHGRYITLTREEIERYVPAPPDTEESRAFERTLTDLTAAIPDGGDLKAWAKEASDESPYDLIAVLDPGRTNADGTPVRKDQWKALYPATCTLLANARKDLDGIGLKKLHPRVRPHIPDKFESYPSGHTYRAALQAAVLSQVQPARSRDLFREMVTLGMLRAVIAVHYPTDIWDGFIIGQYVGLKMKGNAQFEADLALAKAEWSGSRP